MARVKPSFIALIVSLMFALPCAAQSLDEAKIALRQRNYGVALSLLNTLSDNQNAEAQYLLATLYAQGRGVAKSDDKAFALMKAAAEREFPQAQYLLAGMYERGRGTAQNQTLALQWYERAAESGVANASEKLKQTGKPSDAKQQNYSRFIRAIKTADLQALPAFLSNKTLLEQRDELGFTPLMIAVESRHPEVVLALLNAGANTDAVTPKGINALILACQLGFDQISTLLLPHTHNVDAGDELGVTALMLAAQLKSVVLVQQLLEAGAGVNVTANNGRTALDSAPRDSKVHAFLRQQGGKSGVELRKQEAPDVVEQLTTLARQNPALQGWPVLNIAAWQGRIDDLPVLLTKGTDVNARDPKGYTALMRAVAQGNAEVITWLLDAGADPQLKAEDGQSALTIAIAANQQDIALTLFKHEEPALDAQTRGTWLLRSLGQEQFTLARYITQGELSASLASQALLMAVSKAPHDLLATLLAAKAEVNAKNAQGQTPLGLAIARADAQVITLLLNGGANPNGPDRNGNTPLCVAAKLGSLSSIDILLQAGASPDIANSEGNTPLMLAILAGNTDTALRLISSGANVTLRNQNTLTALMLVAIQGQSALINPLVEAGAKPLRRNQAGKNAIDLADANQHQDVATVLRELADKHGLLDFL